MPALPGGKPAFHEFLAAGAEADAAHCRPHGGPVIKHSFVQILASCPDAPRRASVQVMLPLDDNIPQLRPVQEPSVALPSTGASIQDYSFPNLGRGQRQFRLKAARPAGQAQTKFPEPVPWKPTRLPPFRTPGRTFSDGPPTLWRPISAAIK